MQKKAEDIIFGRARGLLASLVRLSLSCLSRFFRLAVKTRLFLYRKHWKQQSRLGTMVVSVGNITMGGTGKTPVVEFLARALQGRGRRVAILSRGYKSHSLHRRQLWKQRGRLHFDSLPKIVSDGTDILLPAKYAGDEPLMLARNLPGVAVIVDKDRVNGGRFAISELRSDTLLLDDGFQYLHIEHQIDLVLIDHNRPFGTRSLIPRGTLREPPENLARADCILITKCPGDHADPGLVREIRSHNSHAEIIECSHSPRYLQDVFTGRRLPLSALRGKHLALLSGIAVPSNFENLIRKLGANIMFHRTFTDHHEFTRKEIDSFMQRCLMRDIDMIVTTEKDAVRFHRPEDHHTPVLFLRIEIEILRGQEAWDKLLEKICLTPAS